MHSFALWNDPIFLPVKGQISRSHSTTTSSSLRLKLNKINKLEQVEVVVPRLITTTSYDLNYLFISISYLQKRTYRGSPILRIGIALTLMPIRSISSAISPNQFQ